MPKRAEVFNIEKTEDKLSTVEVWFIQSGRQENREKPFSIHFKVKSRKYKPKQLQLKTFKICRDTIEDAVTKNKFE